MIDVRPDDAEFAELLEELAGEHAAFLGKNRRSAVRFAVRPVPAGEAVGESRIGGDPDLPPGTQWPKWTHPDSGEIRPLVFFAQINLAEVAGVTELPADGLLLFFADMTQEYFGLRGLYADEKDGCRVLHVPTESLVRTPRPEGTWALPEAKWLPIATYTVPEFDDDEDFAAEAVEFEFYDRIKEAVPKGWRTQSRHQLGGHSSNTCHPVEERAIQAVEGVYRRDTEGFDDERWAQVKHKVTEWRPLLQISSDSQLDLCWSDVGALYWVCRVDDWTDVRAWCESS